MYFLRIILVFFFLWLPGMIMYYLGYNPNRNVAGLLHNIGLMFFSLQAIVSNGMAFFKPDVRKAIGELWQELRTRIGGSLCRCCYPRGSEAPDTLPTAAATNREVDIEASLPLRPPKDHRTRPAVTFSGPEGSDPITVCSPEQQ
mmetsp:Transcript_12675/g.29252  ORF Transcript_12675/g.29252 Transcript_12675/m.29252 type:complete len:144 (-) Transcript_12675:433-864(-)